MAPCAYCNQDPKAADGCADIPIELGGSLYRPVLYGDEIPFDPGRWSGRCPDCAVLPAHVHHRGCRGEQCPACRRPLATCSCSSTGMVDRDRWPDPRCTRHPVPGSAFSRWPRWGPRVSCWEGG